MKKNSFSILNIIALFSIFMFALYAICPFNLIDMEQAARIAKWKSEFEKFKYCFSILDMHEGDMAQGSELEPAIADDYMVEKIFDYFDFSGKKLTNIPNYKYKRKNGRIIAPNHPLYFDRFIKCKNGTLVSFKKIINEENSGVNPLFHMFIDINGEEKPNRIGLDIFFIDIFHHNIQAHGYDKDYLKLKQNCSPIGSGFYCSEFYLLGGHF